MNNRYDEINLERKDNRYGRNQNQSTYDKWRNFMKQNANTRRKRDLRVHIKEMHTHMRGTELK
jgi:hypothetical protein